MEINRNQWFLAGLLILFLGIQFRSFESVVLNEKVTRFLAQRSQSSEQVAARGFVPASAPLPRKVVTPPQWLGYSLISVGSVLILHSLGMKKPGG